MTQITLRIKIWYIKSISIIYIYTPTFGAYEVVGEKHLVRQINHETYRSRILGFGKQRFKIAFIEHRGAFLLALVTLLDRSCPFWSIILIMDHWCSWYITKHWSLGNPQDLPLSFSTGLPFMTFQGLPATHVNIFFYHPNVGVKWGGTKHRVIFPWENTIGVGDTQQLRDSKRNAIRGDIPWKTKDTSLPKRKNMVGTGRRSFRFLIFELVASILLGCARKLGSVGCNPNIPHL